MNSNRIGNIRFGSAARNIVRVLFTAVIALALTGIASAQNNGELEFKGAIGVIPVTGGAANGAPTLNVVRGVNPGAPWRIANLDAEVGSGGLIRIQGRGLLLATGNGIGTNAGQSVHASLFCGTGTTVTEHTTPKDGVRLQANGDFRIDDFLSPLPPVTCDSPVLLIRNVGGVWFAAGIQKLGK